MVILLLILQAHFTLNFCEASNSIKLQSVYYCCAAVQSVTKIVRLASPPSLLNVGCKLTAHLWSSLPHMASSGLTQH